MDNDISKFVRDQLSVWPAAAANFRSMSLSNGMSPRGQA